MEKNTPNSQKDCTCDPCHGEGKNRCGCHHSHVWMIVRILVVLGLILGAYYVGRCVSYDRDGNRLYNYGARDRYSMMGNGRENFEKNARNPVAGNGMMMNHGGMMNQNNTGTMIGNEWHEHDVTSFWNGNVDEHG